MNNHKLREGVWMVVMEASAVHVHPLSKISLSRSCRHKKHDKYPVASSLKYVPDPYYPSYLTTSKTLFKYQTCLTQAHFWGINTTHSSLLTTSMTDYTFRQKPQGFITSKIQNIKLQFSILISFHDFPSWRICDSTDYLSIFRSIYSCDLI